MPDGKDSPLPPPPPISWDILSTVIPINPPPPEPKAKDSAEEGQTSRGETKAVDGEDDVSQSEIEAESENVQSDWNDFIEEDDSPTTWHDVALSIAAELMGRIRQDIFTKLGYSTSAVRISCAELTGCTWWT